MSPLCVVKLGGSLLDLPDLASRLGEYLHHLRATGCESLALLVGGGPTTDAVRTLDRTHHLGEAIAHDLALRGLTLNAHFLHALLNQGQLIHRRTDPVGPPWGILEPWSLLREAEEQQGRHLLPHTWEATSDSVALVLADLLCASTLILVKSVGPAGPLNVAGVHPADVVDPCFVPLWRECPQLRVEVVPLREGESTR